MAEISQRIMDMVRRELVENPDVDNAVLYEKARELEPEAMQDVDRRQFNARYPLRVKRFELKARKPKSDDSTPRRRRKSRKPTPETMAAPASPPANRKLPREGVRDILLRFAQDMANAEGRGQLVSVVAGVDQYVEQILGLDAAQVH